MYLYGRANKASLLLLNTVDRPPPSFSHMPQLTLSLIHLGKRNLPLQSEALLAPGSDEVPAEH